MGKNNFPPRILFGKNCLKKIRDFIDEFSSKNILLITGSRSMEKLGMIEKIKEYLVDYNFVLFNKVETNPSIETVWESIVLARDKDIDLVIALGGGSAIDVGKTVAILAKNEYSLKDYLTGKKNITCNGLPFVAIPTTAGTGSEVTKWATIWDKTENQKYSLSHEFMYPTIAILDPLLTLSLPQYITATTGIDALSHAIEACWSIYSNSESDKNGFEAIKLINIYLEKVCAELNNIDYREKMLLASLKAGLAFSKTKTTAVHSVSYPITAYFNIPHGLACGLILGPFLEFNYQVEKDNCRDARGYIFVREKIERIAKALDCSTVTRASIRIRTIMERIGLPIYLKEAGVEDIETVIRNGFTTDRAVNNPRILNEEDLRKILQDIEENK